MDQKTLLMLSVVIVTLAGCSTFRRLEPPQVYEIDLTPPGKTTNFQPVEIDIAAGDLSDSVNDWAKQTDMDVLFFPDDVNGICTLPLKGPFYPIDALRQLLEGTGLTFAEPVVGGFVVVPIGPDWARAEPRDLWRGESSAIGSVDPAQRSN